MRKIDDHLRIGDIVNRSDHAVTNPESFMNDLDHWSYTDIACKVLLCE